MQSAAATLLYLQEAIATVRDKEALFTTVADKLRLIVPFDACAIVTLDPSRLFRRVFLKAYRDPGPDEPYVTGAYGLGDVPVAGSPIELFLGNPVLQEVPIAELRAQYPDFPPLEPLARLGAEWMLVVPLRTAGQVVGLLALSSRRRADLSRRDTDLLEKIGQQVALAVLNLRALEEAETRAADAALQLAVNNALLELKDRDALLVALATEIDRVMPHVFFGIRIQEPDGRVAAFTSLAKVPGAPAGAPQFQFVEAYRDQDPAAAARLAMQRDATALYQQARVYVGADFEAIYARYGIIRYIRDVHGIQSVLYVPLTLRTPGNAVLMLAERRPVAFSAANLATIERLAPQLSLALDNLFAFEQIEQLRARLEQEKTYLLDEIRTTSGFDEIIGTAPVLQRVLARVGQVAATDTTVLIEGETGTGKELIARALHDRSPRARKPLVKVNCAALPAALIESELFGHEKGAFTGAVERRTGKFELADGGTIFLDEIGELPLDLQAKLLRVLQEKEIERVGGRREIKVDVRVIVATNRVLEDEVAAGRFRQDLFYRLTAFPLRLPALRERPEDIPLLLTHFQTKLARRMGKPRRAIRPPDLAALQAWRWPGNIRELEHVVEQAVILSTGTVLDFSNFQPRFPHSPLPAASLPQSPGVGELVSPPALSAPEGPGERALLPSLREQERTHILAALARTGGRVSGPRGAAVLLDINPKTLEARMRRLGIRRTVG